MSTEPKEGRHSHQPDGLEGCRVAPWYVRYLGMIGIFLINVGALGVWYGQLSQWREQTEARLQHVEQFIRETRTNDMEFRVRMATDIATIKADVRAIVKREGAEK